MTKKKPPRPAEPETPAPDLDRIGWRAINREWHRLSKSVGLPEEARDELIGIVAQERYEKGKRDGSEQPAKARKRLNSLHLQAGKLADGLRALGSAAQSAVMIALSEEDQFKHLPRLTPHGETSPFDLEVAAVARWRDRLGRAIEIAKTWRSASGADPGLRRVIERLDQLLILHTGKGLVRASTMTKSLRGRADASQNFVREIIRMTFGRLGDSTIDDAVKDVITRRRKTRHVP